MINRQILLTKLRELSKGTNLWVKTRAKKGISPESAHAQADELLTEYINDNGIATAYDKIMKWYE